MIVALLQWITKHLPSITIPDISGKPYLTRYFLFGKERKFFNIFIHYFHASDMDRSLDNGTLLLHCHPWKHSLSLILAGGYTEERRQSDNSITRKKYPPGSFNYINDQHFHRVELLNQNGWSLFITGWRRTQDTSWGFWDRQERKYIPFREQLEKLGKKVFVE